MGWQGPTACCSCLRQELSVFAGAVLLGPCRRRVPGRQVGLVYRGLPLQLRPSPARLQVLDVITDSVHNFDEVNVATALHRLAKLQPPNQSHQPPSIIYTNQFQQLIYATRTLLSRFEAQAVSNTVRPWTSPPVINCSTGRRCPGQPAAKLHGQGCWLL